MEGCAMFEGQVHDPHVFINALQQYHDTDPERRGELANMISEAIITKRVDLAEVRQALINGGQDALMDTLDRLLELIEPYLAEGGSEE